MAEQGYQVDLDALWTTVKNLQKVADSLDHPGKVAAYDTALKPEQFGTGFAEATTLYGAHDQMKDSVHAMINQLQQLLNDFSGKAGQVHSNYTTQETSTSGDFAS